MNSLFRKAIGLFVVLDDEQPSDTNTPQAVAPAAPVNTSATSTPVRPVPMKESDLSKFEKHFEELFENTNLPGPDYFEFWKMMDTLEAHIKNEKERMRAVFDSLKIQGLTKDKLNETARQYKEAVITDRNNFEAAVQSKVKSEVEARQANIESLTAGLSEKEATIARLQQEIAAAKEQVVSLQQEIEVEQDKIANAQNGYLLACNAMVSKIEGDIKTFGELFGA
ncbi:MAG: hypothetical protein IPL65_04190 [Lewinellaceae bacterium]|nr:hypothetical protein [Lewinellaceae bacterium]